MDLMCYVNNECQMKVYQRKLKQCETLVTKKSDEFIITDKKSFTKQINSKEETYEEWKKTLVIECNHAQRFLSTCTCINY